jgi:hypothetical protein
MTMMTLNRENLYALVPQRHKNAAKRVIAFGRRLRKQTHMTPGFLVIGAQKAGTSSLFNYLIRHGSFIRPLLKDIYYFDREYDRGLGWYLSFYPTTAARLERERATTGPVVSGEMATHYLLNPWAPSRVRETFPDIKLVVLLRNPAQRALAHYYHNLRGGLETAAGPLEAFRLEEERIGRDLQRMVNDPTFYSCDVATYSYLARGRYAEQLRRWLACFPPEQMLVVCSERFFADTDAQFRRICGFVGIPERSLPSYPAVGRGRNRRNDEDALAFARDYFRPCNQDLYELMQENYGWP